MALYEHEFLIASLSVQRAVIATKTVLASVEKGVTAKGDNTPVSLADFAGQALLISAIYAAFPDDIIVGEEDASDLRSNSHLAHQVWELVQSTKLEDEASEKLLSRPSTLEEMLDLIDLGGSAAPSKSGRSWFIDPVDGTKTFLEGTQYCVVAGLLEDGEEKLATFGCPHISLRHSPPKISEAEDAVDRRGPGYLVSAIKDQGTWVRSLSNGTLERAERVEKRPNATDPSALIFTESLDTTTPALPNRSRIAERLEAAWPPVHIYSTQLKYVACALGACDVYLRAPKDPHKAPYVWDHAGGILIFEEAGGKVTDLLGKKVELTAGRKLVENLGILATPEDVHDKVLQATKEAVEAALEYFEVCSK